MGKYVRGVLWGLFFLFLGIDLYAWGGLAITPGVGKQVREQASLRSPLAASYMFAGRKTIEALGRQDQAVAYAAKHFRAEAFSERVQRLRTPRRQREPRPAFRQIERQRLADAARSADQPDPTLPPVNDPGVQRPLAIGRAGRQGGARGGCAGFELHHEGGAQRLVKDSVTSPRRMPNLLITARFSIT